MNISFDLDSTLIPNGQEFETQDRGWLAKLFGVEKLRKGTGRLFQMLQEEGFDIHIYTTSFRSKRKIRWTLKYYGISVERVVNEAENSVTLKKLGVHASKFPLAFGFDIHIDDLQGVGIEAEKYDFKAIIVSPDDSNWIDTILSELKIQQLKFD